MATFGLGKTVLLCEGTVGGEIWKQNTVSLHFVAHGLETIKPHEKLEVGTPVGTGDLILFWVLLPLFFGAP
jgi:hypothetical protein